MSSELGTVVARLHEVESRLERLLAAGWGSAGGEVQALAEEAEALAALGLSTLAAQVRQVAGVTEARTLLPRVALALAASRLLRAHLASHEPPAGPWQPLTADGAQSARHDHLLPLTRISVDSAEAWLCLRRRGAPAGWLLLEPPALDWPSRVPRSGARGLVHRLMGRQPATALDPPWLAHGLHGRLRWQRRFPCGEASVDLCRMVEPQWSEPVGADLLGGLQQALAHDQQDDRHVLARGEALRLQRVTQADVAAAPWPAPGVAELATAALQHYGEPLWALAWMLPPVAILALIAPDARCLIHLVPGLPADALPD